MSNPLLFYADSHHQDGPRAPDTEFAAKQVADIAFKYEVAGVLAGGDILDSARCGPKPVNVLHRFLDDLYDGGVPYRFVLGNHEASGESFPHGHRHAVSLHKNTCELGGVRLYGLDFQPAGRLQEELNSVPKGTELLVAHEMWAELVGSMLVPQGSFSDVPIVPALATGDLHKTVVETYTGRDGQDLLVGSPGSTCSQAINEQHTHYVLLFEDGKFTKKRLRSRGFIKIGPLVRPEELEALLDGQLEKKLEEALQASTGLPEALQRPYMRVTYSYLLADVVRRVEKAVNKRAILYWDELPPDREESEGRAVRAEIAAGGAVTPLAILPDYADVDKDPAVYELVAALLSSPAGQEGALVSWRSAYLAKQTAKEEETNDEEATEDESVPATS